MHNHPSAVEPFQGAAAGVGGIHRDIVAMGGAVDAILDGLRWGRGHLAKPRGGRASGTTAPASVSRPLSPGEAVLDEAYRVDPPVNAMCVGVLPADRVPRAASAIETYIVLYGATTGRDGIGGATVLAASRTRRGRGPAPHGSRSAIRSRQS